MSQEVIFSDITTFKKSKCCQTWPKWLVLTQSVIFGSQDLEIRSHVSSFSGYLRCFTRISKVFSRKCDVPLNHIFSTYCLRVSDLYHVVKTLLFFKICQMSKSNNNKTEETFYYAACLTLKR